MKHARSITVLPAKAQTDGNVAICNDISNDYQAQLCFLVELLTAFFLPLASIKRGGNPNA